MRHLIQRTISLGDWLCRGQSPFRLGTVPLLLGDWLGRLRPPFQRGLTPFRQVSVPVLLLTLSLTTTADAQFNGALRGEYDVTLSRVCKIGTGFNDINIAVNGVANFNPLSGAVSFTGRLTSSDTTSPGANSANHTCTGTYSVNGSGTLSETLNCNLSFIDGFLAPGGTATVNGIDLEGQLSLDGTVVLLRNAVPNTETFQLLTDGAGNPAPVPGTGSPQDRICSVSGLATSRR